MLSQVGVAGGWILEAVQAPPPASSPPAAPASQRLDELETVHTSGAISDTEYAASASKDHRRYLIHNVTAAQPISDILGISSSPKRRTNAAGSGLPGTGPMLIMSMPSSA